jgi:hypothetical protein
MSAERTIQDIEKALNGPLEAPIKKIQGFDYVSWNDSVRQLNRIFGSLGWSDDIVSLTRTELGYTCVMKLTFYLPDGTTRVHTGVGYGVVRTWKDGKEIGLEQKSRAEDQGVKSAQSDALSRACKRWAALGIALYGGEDLPEDDQPQQPVVQKQPQPTPHYPKTEQTKRVEAACKEHGITVDAFRAWFKKMNYTSVDAALHMLNNSSSIDAIKKFMPTQPEPVVEFSCSRGTRENLQEQTKGTSWEAAHAQPPATNQEAMATDRQQMSIKKLCTALNQEIPNLASLTFNQARELLTQLSHTYSEARPAS